MMMNSFIRLLNFCLIITGFYIITSCDRDPVEPPLPDIKNITIAQLRDMYQGTDVVVDTNAYIQGIVTLTPELNNIPDFIAYIQDATGAITLTISGTNTLSMGSEVKIFIRGLTLTEYNGLIQFGDVDLATMSELVKLDGDPVTPAEVTIQDILAGDHVAELVKINNVQFTETGTFTGGHPLTDCIREVDVYTRSAATFASQSLPEGNGSFTGVVSIFNDPQLLIRDPSELSMTGNRCEPPSTEWMNENFESLADNDPVDNLTGWSNPLEKGTQKFQAKSSTGNMSARITAANSGESEVISWLITPANDISGSVNPVLTFTSMAGFENGATFEVLISTNYNGDGSPWNYTWTALSPQLPVAPSNTFSDWVPSGDVDLSSYKGTIYIAFRYTGADPAETLNDDTTTWQIDDVRIAEMGSR